MKVERKRLLLDIINSEIEISTGAAKMARKLAMDFSNGSPSESGDRKAYELSADLAEATLSRLLALKNEVAASPDDIARIAQPVCYVELDYGDGDKEQCYLVDNALQIPHITLITPQSIVGGLILNKKVGAYVTTSVARDSKKVQISFRIVTIE